MYPSQSRLRGHSINIFYRPDATADDILRSVLHATALRRMLLNLEFFNPLSLSAGPTDDEDQHRRRSQRRLEILLKALRRSGLWTASHAPAFKAGLEAYGWHVDEVAFADHGRRVLWGHAIAPSKPAAP